MAAEISSCATRMQNVSREDVAGGDNSEILITRDLLGNLSNGENRDELKWRKSPNSPSPSSQSSKSEIKEESLSSSSSYFGSKLQDLNFPSTNFFLDENCLDLKLQSSSSNANSMNYQSVCTLDKVKSALDRAEKETTKKRAPRLPVSSSSQMFAAACPGCLLYVITSTANPKCPRCNAFVPAALGVGKKPKIDLNASF